MGDDIGWFSLISARQNRSTCVRIRSSEATRAFSMSFNLDTVMDKMSRATPQAA